jgi:hypothetical protein
MTSYCIRPHVAQMELAEVSEMNTKTKAAAAIAATVLLAGCGAAHPAAHCGQRS